MQYSLNVIPGSPNCQNIIFSVLLMNPSSEYAPKRQAPADDKLVSPTDMKIGYIVPINSAALAVAL